MTRAELLRRATGALALAAAPAVVFGREKAAQALASGGVIQGSRPAMLHAGEVIVTPDQMADAFQVPRSFLNGESFAATFRYDLDRPAETFRQVTPWRHSLPPEVPA